MDENKKPWYERAWESTEKFFAFFNGKKNKIGNTALSLYAVAETAVQMNVIPDHTLVAQVVLFAGIGFKLLGIGHKVAKGEINFNKSTLPEGLR